MQVYIHAVGKLKAGPERTLFERYIERANMLAKPLGISSFNLIEIPEARAKRASDRMHEEADMMLSKIKTNGQLIVLDERGTSINSQDFAKLFARSREYGKSSIYFAIGGADGHHTHMRKAAQHILSFGAVTLPHQLVRILLAEQLYRACTILLGHPYHRE